MAHDAPTPQNPEDLRTGPSPVARRGGSGRGWARRGILVLASLAFSLLLLEGTLRLGGWGFPTEFCLWHGREQLYTDNDKFLWQFYSPKTSLRPGAFSSGMPKPAGSIRIVVLGDSPAAGLPEPGYAAVRILERILQDRYAGQAIEVINAAMKGADSHVLVPVAKDSLQLDPDLVVIDVGTQEMLGPYGTAIYSNRFLSRWYVVRALETLRRTRTGQLMEPLFQRLNPEGSEFERKDAVYFQKQHVPADSPRRTVACAHFQGNLTRICRMLRRAGVPVVLATVPANLRDCPPFASVHRAGLTAGDQARWDAEYQEGLKSAKAGDWSAALSRFLAAAAVDDHFAELHFHLARCYLNLGDTNKAVRTFAVARDWDALPLRGESRYDEVVRAVASRNEGNGVLLADVQKAFQTSELSDRGIPGNGLFLDHVHPTFAGQYLLARTLLAPIQEALGPKLRLPAKDPKPILSPEECARSLAYTPITEALIASTIFRQTAVSPFTEQWDHAARRAQADRRLKKLYEPLGRKDLKETIATFQEAIRRRPDDWQLVLNFARLLYQSTDYPEAINQYETARRLLPHSVPIRLGLTRALTAAGRLDDALWQLNEALALDPQSEAVRDSIAAVQALRQTSATRERGRPIPKSQ